MKIFSLLLPTRDRIGLVKQLFDSIVRTTAELDCLEILLYTDRDDEESREIDHPLLSISRLSGENETMGNITRRCYEQSRGKYVMLVNDDMIFRTKGWDKIVLERFDRSPDGIALVYGNDLYYGKRMCTFPILSRTACELMGKICPAEYKRHCIDPHILDIFNRLEKLGSERIIYLPRVIFEHMHYELSLLVNDSETSQPNDTDDQEMFFLLASRRQQIAEDMAKHIQKQQNLRLLQGQLT